MIAVNEVDRTRVLRARVLLAQWLTDHGEESTRITPLVFAMSHLDVVLNNEEDRDRSAHEPHTRKPNVA